MDRLRRSIKISGAIAYEHLWLEIEAAYDNTDSINSIFRGLGVDEVPEGLDMHLFPIGGIYVLPNIFLRFFSYEVGYTVGVPRIVVDSTNILMDISLSLLQSGRTKYFPVVDKKRCLLDASLLSSCPELQAAWNACRWCRDLVSAYQSAYIGRWSLGLDGFNVLVTKDYIIILDRPYLYICTRDIINMIVSKVNEWFCLVTCAYLHQDVYGNLGPTSVVKFLWKLADLVYDGREHRQCFTMSYKREQDALSFIKSLEAVIQALLIAQCDNKVGYTNHFFLDRVLESILRDHPYLSDKFNLASWVKKVGEWDIAEISELMGMIKSMGFVAVDVVAGIETVHTYGSRQLNIDPDLLSAHRAVLMRDFLLSYTERNKKPPAVISACPEVLKGLLTYTKQSYMQFKIWVVNLKEDELLSIDLMPIFSLDRFHTILPLIKDSALGKPRSEYHNILDEMSEHDGLFDINANLEPSMLPSRTLAYAMYSSSLFPEFRKYIDEYHLKGADVFNDEWILNYLVIKLTAKEGELKHQARLFGASPWVERGRRVAMQYNVFDYLSEYEKYDFLTPGESASTDRILRSALQGLFHNDKHVVNVTWDFSKFCNTMRSSIVDGSTGKFLNTIFDTRIFETTQSAYQHCLLISKIPSHSAEPSRFMGYEGMEGGIEGLNQAEWTLTAIKMLEVSFEKSEILEYDMTVKGDDVRAVWFFDNTLVPLNSLQQHVEDKILKVSTYLAKFGMISKVEEVSHSKTLITSSKRSYFMTTSLPSTYKLASKCLAMEDNSLDILSTRLETIASSCYALSRRSLFPVKCLLMYYFFMASEIHLSIIGKMAPDLNTLVCLLLTPTSLGGLASFQIDSFFFRGVNDYLTSFCGLVIHMITTTEFRDLGMSLRHVLLREPDEKIPLWHLYRSIYGLRFKQCMTGKDVFKSMVKDALRTVVTNPEIASLAKLSSSDSEELVSQSLHQSRIDTKLAAFILENTKGRMFQEMVAQFELPQTIIELFPSRKRAGFSRHLHHKVRIAEMKWVSQWKDVFKYRANSFLSINTCSTEWSINLRKTHWGRSLREITYPSPLGQSLLMDLRELMESCENNQNQYDVMVKAATRYHEHIPNQSAPIYLSSSKAPQLTAFADSSYYPFRGSKVNTKFRFLKLNYRTHNSEFRRFKNLLLAAAYSKNRSTTVYHLCLALSKQYYDIASSDLQWLVPQGSGGTEAHRLQMRDFDPVTEPNFIANYFSTWSHNTDRATELSKVITQNCNMNVVMRIMVDIFKGTLVALSGPVVMIKPQQFYSLVHPRDVTYGIGNINILEYNCCPDCLYIFDEPPFDYEVREIPKLDGIYHELASTSEEREFLMKAVTDVKLESAFSDQAYDMGTSPTTDMINHTHKMILEEFLSNGEDVYSNQLMVQPTKILSPFMREAYGLVTHQGSMSISCDVLRRIPSALLVCAILSRMWEISPDPNDPIESDGSRYIELRPLVDALAVVDGIPSCLDFLMGKLTKKEISNLPSLTLADINTGDFIRVCHHLYLFYLSRYISEITDYIEAPLLVAKEIKSEELERRIWKMMKTLVLRDTSRDILRDRQECSYRLDPLNLPELITRFVRKGGFKLDGNFTIYHSMEHHTAYLKASSKSSLYPHNLFCANTSQCHNTSSVVNCPPLTNYIMSLNCEIYTVNMQGAVLELKQQCLQSWAYPLNSKTYVVMSNPTTPRHHCPKTDGEKENLFFKSWYCRILGKTTSAASKLHEVLAMADLDPTRVDSLWAFADGVGGFSAYFYVNNPAISIVYSSLREDIHQNIRNVVPEIAQYERDLNRDQGANTSVPDMGDHDILSERSLRNLLIQYRILSHFQAPNVVCCDIDTPSSDLGNSYLIMMEFLREHYSSGLPVLILKWFSSIDESFFEDLVHRSNTLQYYLHLVSPITISPTSSELYIIASPFSCDCRVGYSSARVKSDQTKIPAPLVTVMKPNYHTLCTRIGLSHMAFDNRSIRELVDHLQRNLTACLGTLGNGKTIVRRGVKGAIGRGGVAATLKLIRSINRMESSLFLLRSVECGSKEATGRILKTPLSSVMDPYMEGKTDRYRYLQMNNEEVSLDKCNMNQDVLESWASSMQLIRYDHAFGKIHQKDQKVKRAKF